jgi:4-hydroxybenzoate polyprenyltransferase
MARRPKVMAVQGAAMLIATAFLMLGVLGFIPGATSHLDQLQWAGHHSSAKLFGMFTVSALHNVVHLASGVVGFIFARTYAASRAYLLAGGLAYLALWIYGIVLDQRSALNILPLNNAGNWLHFGLGAVMVLLALTLAGQRDPTKRPPRRAKVRT